MPIAIILILAIVAINYKIKYDRIQIQLNNKLYDNENEVEKTKAELEELQANLESVSNILQDIYSNTIDLKEKIKKTEPYNYEYSKYEILKDIEEIESLSDDGVSIAN